MVKIYTEGHDTVHHPSHYATQALTRHIECQDIRRHLPQAVDLCQENGKVTH